MIPIAFSLSLISSAFFQSLFFLARSLLGDELTNFVR